MTGLADKFMRQQLLDRRRRLEDATVEPDRAPYVHRLLEQVDAALERLDDGSYGICESCHDTIERDRLIADPLVRVCLDHLTRQERSALEQDLELAALVQRGLLPPQNLTCAGWQVAYHYEPAGVVSGDYCDVVDAGASGLYFMLGDVSGKGVAASMLMAQLHAMFRTLISVGLSLKDMLGHASRVFSESTLPTHYATLVCGRAEPNGRVELCNAGHPPPLVVSDGAVVAFETSGLPVGLFRDEEFLVGELQLGPCQSILLYSDGVSEALDGSGAEYGTDRMRKLIGERCATGPAALIAACREDLGAFRNGARRMDDVTMLALGRVGQ